MEDKIESLLDNIPQPSHFFCYLRGCWANGKEGAITDSSGHGVYRFFPIVKDANGNRIDAEIDFDDYVTNPVVATGIIGYWLHYRKNNNRLTSYTTWKKESERKNTLKIFSEEVTSSGWRRNLEKEFYTDFIIRNEEPLNEQTEALMEYITPADRKVVREVMSEYMLFLEEKRKAYMPTTEEKSDMGNNETNNAESVSSPQNKHSRRRGRPSKVFEDFMHKDAPSELMSVLEEMMNGADGKTALTIILSITGVYIDEPTVKSVCDRFNTVGQTAYGQAKARHEGRPYGKYQFDEKREPIGAEAQKRMLDRINQKIKEAQGAD